LTRLPISSQRYSISDISGDNAGEGQHKNMMFINAAIILLLFECVLEFMTIKTWGEFLDNIQFGDCAIFKVH